jgi:hypothetical protein
MIAKVEPVTTAVTLADSALIEHANAIRALRSRIVSDVAEIGRRLAEVKRLVGHGNWLPWLEREFGWSEDTAERFIRVHEFVERLPDSASVRNLVLTLPISSVYLLAALSTPESARDAVLERAANGEKLTHAQVKQAIETAKGGQQPRPKPTTPNLEFIDAEQAAREMERRDRLFAPVNVIKAVRKSLGEIGGRVHFALADLTEESDRHQLLAAVHQSLSFATRVFAPDEKPARDDNIDPDSRGEADRLGARIEALQAEIARKRQCIKELKAEVREKDHHIRKLAAETRRLDGVVTDLMARLEHAPPSDSEMPNVPGSLRRTAP